MGTPAVVTLGDSAISGEAGRWAGNTNNSSSAVDALGPTAYYDAGSGEAIPGCHRSKSAEAHIGGGVLSANFACSGAHTSTGGTASGDDFKPGIDFYSDSSGRIGQAQMLQNYAKTHNVKAVVLMIGANNYGFADILQSCVIDWLYSPSWWRDYCQDDSSVTARFTSSRIATETTNVRNAMVNIAWAMYNAGYGYGDYTVLAQTYWSPLPSGNGFRYPETGYTRQTVGGCGTWNSDATWANNTVVNTFNNTVRNAAAQATSSGMPNIKILDLQDSLVGHRLCENTAGLLEEKGVSSWTQAGAVDKSEWVEQIRTTSTISGPYQLQEDGHANYWGQLAMRDCLRLAYNNGVPRGGKCTHVGSGLNSHGEPPMTLN